MGNFAKDSTGTFYKIIPCNKSLQNEVQGNGKNYKAKYYDK